MYVSNAVFREIQLYVSDTVSHQIQLYVSDTVFSQMQLYVSDFIRIFFYSDLRKRLQDIQNLYAKKK